MILNINYKQLSSSFQKKEIFSPQSDEKDLIETLYHNMRFTIPASKQETNLPLP